MVPIIVIPAFFFAFVTIIRIISNNATRKKLIDKGMVDENVRHLWSDTGAGNIPSALKWGMVLVGVGIAVVVGQVSPPDYREAATLSSMLILGGVALIAYYFIATKLFSQNK